MSASTDIITIRNLIIPTLLYPSADKYGNECFAEMARRPQTIDRALQIIEHLHAIYAAYSLQPDGDEYTKYEVDGPYPTTLPMTKAAESRIRAINRALSALSQADKVTLYRFFDMLPSKNDQDSWLHDNMRAMRKDEFVVVPQAWIIRAGVARIGEFLRRPGYKCLYDALEHRDETWKVDEGLEPLERNGMLWLGKQIEKWGWSVQDGLKAKRR